MTLGFDLYQKESAKMNKINGLNYGMRESSRRGDVLSQSVDVSNSLNTLNVLHQSQGFHESDFKHLLKQNQHLAAGLFSEQSKKTHRESHQLNTISHYASGSATRRSIGGSNDSTTKIRKSPN